MVGVASIRSDEQTTHHARSTTRATLLGIVAALAGLMFGLDTGVVSGALPFIATDFHLSSRTQEWIVSSMMAGATFGSLLAGNISARFGRTGAMMGAAILFLLGTFACAFAPAPAILIVGRVFLGLAVGIAAFAAPLYISEITVESARGAMISFYQLMVSLGIFLAFLSDSLLSGGGHWRWMLGIMAVPATLFLLSVLYLPHSPRWLMIQNRKTQARRVLNLLRSDEEVAAAELSDIEARLQQGTDKGRGSTLFWRNGNFRRSVFLGMILQVMQQLTGINVLMYYAPRVFEAAHFGTSAAVWATTLVGLTNMTLTAIAIVFVDKWGRRPLLILSCVIAAASMGGIGLILWSGAQSFGAQLALVGCVLLFVAGFAIGEGPLVWTLCSEVQPTRGRDFGIGCSTVTNWAANCLVSNTFLSLMAAVGSAGTFILFAVLNGAFIIVTLAFVPETKGVSLETIETNLLSGKRLRDIGR
ncbi:sugar-proton symporter [Neoasaia chiangmaiensis NBRC 101099]|uniref:D-galactose transporter GalP n=1 Tax=Neoasaia chiangmaiensis TaxID=320497 RepID=A0A1U9KMK3_9PROT|nr:sugar porter family MFS transporter [Neoasaia chiangmaiensis]AQS87013.1 D-galactose transporter GalP [Neoasaia chiangmaiensis]GBR37824.1 sugar-proton symporter [Neoasaia chiangmaiensis NBRC 101099]GEN15141.1 galactose-proton symporter [Neoasaia chiangmaiensis]